MAHTDKSVHKKEKHALIKEIKENKESLRHGRDIVITLSTFTYIANEIVTHTENPTFLETVTPALALFGLGATLIVIGKNIWDLDKSKEILEEITMVEADKASQNTKKAVQTNYEHRRKTNPIPQAIKLQ